jgi:hypothetical protein
MSGIFAVHRRQKTAVQGWIIVSVIMLGLKISGCSFAKPPTEAFSKAELGLRAASEAKAGELAPMDMQSAREKLEGAKRAMAAERYEDARRLAESAQVEAELAEAKAEAEIMRHAADELRKRIDVQRMEAELGSRK